MKLPYGADEILKVRENKQRPAEAVIVSCIGKLREGNPVVIVNEARHDWRFLTGLDAYVFVGKNARFVRETLAGVAKFAGGIVLWDNDAQRGMNLLPVWDYDPKTWKPRSLVRWARLTWTDHENRRFAQ